MAARMDAATSTEASWVAAAVAGKLHGELVETDPELLDGWLQLIAPECLRLVLVARSRTRRAVARRRAASRAFGEAARAGDTQQLLGLFSVDLVVNDDQLRKRASEMTGPDHLYVAERYQASANEGLLLAAFHRAIARKLGKRRTCDLFTAEQYEQLYLSITRTAST